MWTENGRRRGIARTSVLATTFGVAVLTSQLGAAPAAEAMTTDQEVGCLAQTIYFESRGEPAGGMLAVGHVVLNRSRDPSFPHGICAVVHQRSQDGRCQFSFACDGKSDRPKNGADWAQSVALAKAIYAGRTTDPTRGALWFHRASVRPDWGPGIRRTARIGRHVFYSRRVSA
jgi:spore germination cell wall hydrolase CwlJ-like protein